MTNLTNLLRQVPVSESAKLAVVERLREPHRRYHNLDHVLEMWQWHQQHRPIVCQSDDQIVASFCLYHDAIYDPQARAKHNEIASADLWLADSRDYAPQTIRMAVDLIIAASADHFESRRTAALDALHPILCWCIDLDLMRLGSTQFEHHGDAIRAEYHHLTEHQWVMASSLFRAKAMAQSNIFTYDDFALVQMQARRNLSKALMQDWQVLGYLS